MATEATIEQLKQTRTEGAVVIDVREPDEYAEGHVAGAVAARCTGFRPVDRGARELVRRLSDGAAEPAAGLW